MAAETLYNASNKTDFDITLFGGDGEGIRVPANKTIVVAARFVRNRPPDHMMDIAVVGDDPYLPRCIKENPELRTALSSVLVRAEPANPDGTIIYVDDPGDLTLVFDNQLI